ncbi:MAG: glycosyltransferase [Eubacteriales bacterium]|nr:glycosyltransferase [Eubacteriales bacterium]
MNKVLILSCSTGQGHNSCAQAIAEYFTAQGVPCQIRDSLDFVSPRFARFISRGHSWMYRYLPWLFRFGYGFSEGHSGFWGQKQPVYRLLATGADRLYAYIGIHRFDTVISTHVFSAIMVDQMKAHHPLEVGTAYVSTDYTCHPGAEIGLADRCFIPAQTLKDCFTGRGIPESTLRVSGIPVRRAFFRRTDRADAKRLLGIDAGHKHLLIACGSMGCGPMVRILSRIARGLPEDTEVSVICGTNRLLHTKMELHFGKNPQIHIIGYTNQMSLYLDAADLYVTKPGGISITEAAVKGVPMAFVSAVGGCEGYNQDFFLKLGAAVTAGSPAALARESLRLLAAPGELAAMEQALKRWDCRDGAMEIFRQLQGGRVCDQRKYG